MDIRGYLNNRMSERNSDITKYFSSTIVATAVSLLTKGLSSSIIKNSGFSSLTTSVSSSVLCTLSFFGTRWPLYHYLHEERYKKLDTSERERKLDLTTTIISSVLTNTISMGGQYLLIEKCKFDPGWAGVLSQLAGGGAGFASKTVLDYCFRLITPSVKRDVQFETVRNIN